MELTFAPFFPSSRAMPAPMPRDPPVIIAHLFFRERFEVIVISAETATDLKA